MAGEITLDDVNSIGAKLGSLGRVSRQRRHL